MPDVSPPSEITDRELHPVQATDRSFWIIVSAVTLGSIFLNNCYFWVMHPLRMGADQSLLIAISEMMMQGKQLYTQIHEINPPLIVYINLIPAVICEVFHCTAAHALAVFVMGLTFFSVSVASILAYTNREDEQSFYFLPLLMSFLLFIKSDVMFEFGQKEQLLCISYVPFLFVRYLRWKDKKIGIVIAVGCGILVGIGICLKHYFLLMAFAPELIYFLQKQKWKPLVAPEVVAAVVVGIIYVVHFLFLPKAVLDTLFNFILPVVQQGYDYYTVSPMMTLDDFRSEFYQFALLILLAIPLSKYNRLLPPVIGFTLASAVAYLVAGQNWSYHLTPLRFGLYVTSGLEAATAVFLLRQVMPMKHDRFDAIMGYALILLTTGWLAANLLGTYFDTLNTEKDPITALGYHGTPVLNESGNWNRIVADYSQPGEPILFITRGVTPGYPLTLQSGRKAGSRYPHAMTLLMAKYIAWEKHGIADKKHSEQLLNRVIEEYAEDIKNNKPALIVVQKSEVHAVLTKFDFYKKFMADYRQTESLPDYLIFTRRR